MMKQRNILLFTLILALIPMAGHAAEVTPQTAEQVARIFWNLHHDKDVAAQELPMQRLDIPWDAFYIFAPVEGKGFVIVAADDRVRPVLAYSFHNAAMRDTVGRDMAWWLDGWQHQIDAARNEKSDIRNSEWQRLLEGGDTPSPLTALAPMVTTQWDQDNPYNDSCPSANVWGHTMHAATGCVATAMAQVMKYWNYPVRGTGTHTYYSTSVTGYGSGFGNQTANFGATVYDWDNMPDRLTSVSSNVQKAAVATLMYHCGVACDMSYGTAYEGGSGAMIHNIPYMFIGHTLNGMVKFFGYSSEATGMDRIKYDDSTWTVLVRGELDASRPIVYAGGDETSGGHCFVCDGYDNENRYHFNWGWSGDGDGYYTLDHLAPGSGGTGGGTGTYDFTNLQQILVGIQPHTGEDSLCIIRQFPYLEDFEVAPTCWEATASSNYSYSWMVSDSTGVNGTYSAGVYRTLRGTSEDHLFSPAIVTPGNYKVSWQVRSTSAWPESYTLSVDTVLFADTAITTDWQSRELLFSVAVGDTVRLDFVRSSTTRTGGLMLDNITIEILSDPEPIPDTVAIDIVESSDITIYPNPASDVLQISSNERILRLELFDVTGRMVENVNVGIYECENGTNTLTQLQVNTLPAGVYLLRCVAPNSVTVHRVVKK